MSLESKQEGACYLIKGSIEFEGETLEPGTMVCLVS